VSTSDPDGEAPRNAAAGPPGAAAAGVPRDDPLGRDLAAVVGEAHVLTDPSLTAPYETDWTRRWSGRARCVVRPRDTAEVAAVVRVCAANGAAVVPQGGNTGLVGGAVPAGGEVVVSLTRLDDLEPVDVLAGQLTAGAGVTIARLQDHAAAAGLAYGVDLAARDTATVGGTIATNAGGMHVVAHGTTRAQVVGLEAVLADGSVVSRLGGLVKDNVGYDLPGLLVGSEGTLAIVTRARLRLVPRLAHRLVALLAVDDLAAAVALTAHLRGRMAGLTAVEYIEQAGVDLVVERAGVADPFPGSRHPAHLVVEVAGAEPPTELLAAAVAEAPGIRDVAVAEDGPGRLRLWAVREAHTEAIAAVGVPHKLDVTLPLGRIAAFRDALGTLVAVRWPDARLLVFGHLADGNLHVNVLGADPAEPDPDDDGLDRAVLELVAEHGGSISSEHGIGRQKAAYVHLGRSDVDVAAMRAVKRALDPDGRLNPGVLFPPA
jgi:FAD/FMN-containing dehydrogenase